MKQSVENGIAHVVICLVHGDDWEMAMMGGHCEEIEKHRREIERSVCLIQNLSRRVRESITEALMNRLKEGEYNESQVPTKPEGSV